MTLVFSFFLSDSINCKLHKYLTDVCVSIMQITLSKTSDSCFDREMRELMQWCKVVEAAVAEDERSAAAILKMAAHEALYESWFPDCAAAYLPRRKQFSANTKDKRRGISQSVLYSRNNIKTTVASEAWEIPKVSHGMLKNVKRTRKALKLRILASSECVGPCLCNPVAAGLMCLGSQVEFACQRGLAISCLHASPAHSAIRSG